MTAAEVLARLKADGVGVTLALDLEATTEPTPEVLQLIRDNRDTLLEYLAGGFAGSDFQRAGTLPTPEQTGLTLYGNLLHSLCVWIGRYHELRLEHPGGVILNAKPEHITTALAERWGVVYTGACHVLLSWGDVPTSALLDKRDLLTDKPLVTETRAA